MKENKLHIGLSLSPTWLRANAWKRGDSDIGKIYTLDFYLDIAQQAEKAKLDFLFKPDTLFANTEVLEYWFGFTALDSTVLIAALARETSHIGFVTTVSTTYNPPYLIARQLQSLNWITKGRIAWNMVTSLGGTENFKKGEILSSVERYEKAKECVDVVRNLWDSFPNEALVFDKKKGRYADTKLIRPVHYRGNHFQIDGPLNVPKYFELNIPLFQAGASATGLEFAAQFANAVFASCKSVEIAKQQRDSIRKFAKEKGRIPDEIKFLPGLSLYLAETREEAEKLFRETNNNEVPYGYDSADRSPKGASHWEIVGTVKDAVEEIVVWVEKNAIDGFILLPGGSWGSFNLALKELIPALTELGLFRREYVSTTLEGHLDLSAF